MPGQRDVVVIGGGQAGLASSRALQRRAVDHLVVDGGASAGSTWRSRWDSLRLFTPAWYSSLRDLAMPGDPTHYPHKDEVADYLDDYERRWSLPVEHGVRVTRLTRRPTGFRLVTSEGRELTARAVVVATGAFQEPVRPDWADRLGSTVTQCHTVDYRNPRTIPIGTTLVVGAGNSGMQIALELADSGREVHLAVGSWVPVVPQRPLGIDLFTWLHRLRLIDVGAKSWLGRRMAANAEVIVGPGPRELARRGRVILWPRATDGDKALVRFEDGRQLPVDVVVWATGFRRDHSWIDIEGAVDARGGARHDLGQSPISGLHFVGLPWQRSVGSALLGGVSRDAERTAATIAR